MKVITMMKELKEQGYASVWIKDNKEGYEYAYGLKGYSSIDNEEYVERYKDIFERRILKVEIMPANKDARITYQIEV